MQIAFLTVRMVLYFLFAGAAGAGIATHDPVAGTLTLDIESLTSTIVGTLGFIGTFVASRFARVR